MTETFSMGRRNPAGGTEPLDRWGVDSETGTLREVLLGPIDHLTRILPTNSMNRKALAEGIRLDRPRLRAQYREVLDCFADAGVRVHHPPADERLPLQIWARDSSFMTPWGMIVGQMAQWWRRGEYGPVLDFCFAQNLPIYAKVTAGAYEGGDFMLIKPGHLLLGYSGERSQVEAAAQIQEWFEAEGWEVCRYPFDPYFVHADCTLAMLAPGLIAACTDVVPPSVARWLEGLGIELLEVPFRHVGSLGLNVLSLGGDRVLLPRQSDFLAERCRALGLRVYDPDVSAITVVGGGIHCMCQPLKRD